MTASSTAPRRALFVINSLAGGGAERVMSTLLHHSRREADGFELHLVLLDRTSLAYPLPGWLRIAQLDCRGSLTASAVELHRLARRLQPAVVMSFLTRANVANVYAARRLGYACVVSERTTTSRHLGSGLRGLAARQWVRLAYPRADRVIAVSKGVVDDLTRNFKVPAGRVCAIDNPVDTAGLHRLAEEEPSVRPEGSYVVAAGRLDPLKRFDLAIEAFAATRVADRLVILGEGPDRPRLEAVAERLGVADRVLLPGFCPNPFAVVKRARLFVLSSEYEGFPNSMVEAMALGVPVVATNCASGPSEILAHASPEEVTGVVRAQFGVLAPPRSATALTEAFRIMEDEEVRAAYGRAALERSRDFDAGIVTDRYWNVLRTAAAEKQLRRPARRGERSQGSETVAEPRA